MLTRYLRLTVLIASGLALVACSSGSAEQSDAILETTATAAATTVVTPTATLTPTPTVASLDYGTKVGVILTRLVEQGDPLADLMDAPRPNDAQWRTDVRDIAVAMKQSANELRNLAAPGCMQLAANEVTKIADANTRMADELIAGIDSLDVRHFDAAHRALNESGVYLRNATEQFRQVQC